MKNSWQILNNLALITTVAKVKTLSNINGVKQLDDLNSISYQLIETIKSNVLCSPLVVLFCPAFSWSVVSLVHLKK